MQLLNSFRKKHQWLQYRQQGYLLSPESSVESFSWPKHFV